MRHSNHARLVSLVLAGLLIGTESPAHAASCSVPVTSGPAPHTNDCLYILRAAVELESCDACVCDADGSTAIVASDAHLCLRTAVGLVTALACPPCATTTTVVDETTTTTEAPPTTTTTLAPTTTTTTTTLPPNEACPGAVEWTTQGRYGALCDVNADCTTGVCDEASGRCQTKTRLDMGWTGVAHGLDVGEGATTRLAVRCDADDAPCGECEVRGIDPSPGNCRCANDSRTICDQPLEPDADDCASCAGGAKNGWRCSSDVDCPGGSCSGAAMCQCYQSPPIPFSAGGTPLCMLPGFAADPQGTVNVDSGGSEVALSLRTRVYLGIGLRSPCPVCGGKCTNDASKFCVRDGDCPGSTCDVDDVAGDGVRGGVCSFGVDYESSDRGQPCDTQTFDASFPAGRDAPGGGWYSLDCMPDNGKNVTGVGLRLQFTETTGSISLGADASCQGDHPSLDCPCLVCNGDFSVPCNKDEDCADSTGVCQLGNVSSPPRCASNTDCANRSGGSCNQFLKKCSLASFVSCTTNSDCTNVDFGACTKSTCSSRGIGEPPRPNECENLDCSDTGDGVGSCATGPTYKYCSNVVAADGRGIVSCSTNSDCLFGVINVVDAGNCTLEERPGCFLDPIEATGDADPHQPLLAEAYCLPPSSGAGKNAAIGLPGPARARKQTTLRSWCDADREKLYTPGVGGCAP